MKIIQDFWIGSREPATWLPSFLQLTKDVFGISVADYTFTQGNQSFPFFYSWAVEGTEEELDVFRYMFEKAQEHNK